MTDDLFHERLEDQEFDSWDEVVDAVHEIREDIITDAQFNAETFNDATDKDDMLDLAEEYGFTCNELEESEEE